MPNGSIKRGYSLRRQLMLRFMAISLIPVVVVGVFSLWSTSYFGLQEKVATETADVHTVIALLNTELMYVREAGIKTQYIELVQQVLERERTDAGFQPDENERHRMRAELMATLSENKVHSIYVYGMRGNVYTSQPTVLLGYEKISAYDWYREGVASGRNYFWGEPVRLNSVWVLPYVRRITDPTNRILLGYSVTNLYESILTSSYISHGDVYVLSDDGTILSASDKSEIGQNFYEANGISGALLDGRTGYANVRGKGPRTYAVFSRNTFANPSLAKLFVYNNSQIIDNMLIMTGVTSASCIVVCAFLSAYLSKRFVRPLRKIRETVDRMRLGELSAPMHPRTDDEIGMLMDSFNNMSARLQASLEEIQRINEMRRRAEYRAIELQINPHFLYNTLSLIIYLADAGEADKVKQVSSALSTLFRISVNRGRELVRIAEEISHLRCYMDILSVRHQGEFKYVLDVDPAILEYYTIKIILQPLVENAIQHGIRDNMIADGFIRVTAHAENGRVIFEIMDNGDIPASRIEEMNAALRDYGSAQNFGIGMRNVDSRIRMFFKGDYGLSYLKRGEFTVARIEIPVLEEDRHV